MSRAGGTYDALVSASSAEEALEIALEGLPKGATLVSSTAVAVEDESEPTFQVTLKFKRADKEEGGFD